MLEKLKGILLGPAICTEVLMSLYILEMYSEVKRNTRKIEVKRNTRKISSKSNSVPRLFFLLSSWLSDVSHLHSHFTQVSIFAHILVLWYSPSECFQKDIFFR